MKDKNIIQALNRVLSEYFDVPCKFQSFSAEVPTELFDCGIVQGFYSSEVVFFSQCNPSLEKEDADATYLSGQAVSVFNSDDVFEYTALLCHSSKLRKEILKVMLEHNGEIV